MQDGLAPDIAQARALVMAGTVLVDDRPMDKPGAAVSVEATVRLREKASPWASRGGLKLDHALTHWGIEPTGQVCLDVGASTGGFTDVLLNRGAARVYAVDVGYGRLAWRLARDPRVVVVDRTSVRNLTSAALPEPVDFLSMDVSFIALAQALPPALVFLRSGGGGVALIKPQFELRREQVAQGGVVRDPGLHEQAVTGVLRQAADWGVTAHGTTPSPITGPKGNREFLFYFSKP